MPQLVLRSGPSSADYLEYDVKLPKLKMPSQKTRGYLYRVFTVVGLVLVAKGLVTESELHLYDLLVTAVLGVASANTPVKE